MACTVLNDLPCLMGSGSAVDAEVESSPEVGAGHAVAVLRGAQLALEFTVVVDAGGVEQDRVHLEEAVRGVNGAAHGAHRQDDVLEHLLRKGHLAHGGGGRELDEGDAGGHQPAERQRNAGWLPKGIMSATTQKMLRLSRVR